MKLEIVSNDFSVKWVGWSERVFSQTALLNTRLLLVANSRKSSRHYFVSLLFLRVLDLTFDLYMILVFLLFFIFLSAFCYLKMMTCFNGMKWSLGQLNLVCFWSLQKLHFSTQNSSRIDLVLSRSRQKCQQSRQESLRILIRFWYQSV